MNKNKINRTQRNHRGVSTSILQTILLATLMLICISGLALARGQDDSDIDGSKNGMGREHSDNKKWNKDRTANREAKIKEYFSALEHGSLSDQENKDMLLLNTQLAELNALSLVIKEAHWAEIQASADDTTTSDSKLKNKSSSKNNWGNINSTVLTYVASSYDLTLDTVDTTNIVSELQNMDMPALISKAEEDLVTHIDSVQNAFVNADDEDIKAVYKLLQRSAIHSITWIGKLMLQQGLPVSQRITDTINNTVTNTESAGYNFFDHADGFGKRRFGNSEHMHKNSKWHKGRGR